MILHFTCQIVTPASGRKGRLACLVFPWERSPHVRIIIPCLSEPLKSGIFAPLENDLGSVDVNAGPRPYQLVTIQWASPKPCCLCLEGPITHTTHNQDQLWSELYWEAVWTSRTRSEILTLCQDILVYEETHILGQLQEPLGDTQLWAPLVSSQSLFASNFCEGSF